jgi:hypothetical protein
VLGWGETIRPGDCYVGGKGEAPGRSAGAFNGDTPNDWLKLDGHFGWVRKIEEPTAESDEPVGPPGVAAPAGWRWMRPSEIITAADRIFSGTSFDFLDHDYAGDTYRAWLDTPPSGTPGSGFVRRVAPGVAAPSVKAGNGIDRSKVTTPALCRELLDGEVILPTDRFLDGKGWKPRAGTKSCGKPYRRDGHRITVRRIGDRLASEGFRLLTAGEKVQADDVFIDGYGCGSSIKPMSYVVGMLADGWIKPDDRCEYRWARRIAAVPAPAPAAPAPAAPAPAAPAPAPRSFHVCVGLGEVSASVPRFDGRILVRIDSRNGLIVALPLTRNACRGLVNVLTKALDSR